MIDELLHRCDTRYKKHNARGTCSDCSFGDFCPKSCEKCLETIHFPDHADHGAPPRKYDCSNMADFYVCKYAIKYTSEMIYALECLEDIKTAKKMNVLSFGCGPCTDLLALAYLRKNNSYKYSSLEYRGIDYCEDVWQNVHNDILRSSDNNELTVKYYYEDACEIIDTITVSKWIPNLVIFQYFFSDLNKHTEKCAATSFIRKFSEYVNESLKVGTYIVINDINLKNSLSGGRDYFDILYNGLIGCEGHRGYFINDNRPNTFPYGDKCDRNDILFDPQPWDNYSPFTSCSSAQMIIKKIGDRS